MSDEAERAERLRRARKEAGLATPTDAINRHGWNANTYKSNENANAPFSFKKAKDYATAYGVRAEWLYSGMGPMRGNLVPVIGSVGADPSGLVLLAYGDSPGAFVPLPPGGSEKAVALQVRGHSMPDVAPDGALIYFEHQQMAPNAEMLGEIVVVETEGGEVLIKRLLRGSKRHHYDLESLIGETRHDVRLLWAARISATIPPWKARQIIIKMGEAA